MLYIVCISWIYGAITFNSITFINYINCFPFAELIQLIENI